ncbi:hypothetical protein SEA_TEATEALATTE_89 [Gordonia phage Teatealatte]|uniref:Uncharacterized protein n=2 Tax=Demosthenesvirus katyusha TaxID=1982108 RepID=A0A345MCC5_9CAUD|nr:hypothetical protein SEA_TEATEALATTE_89 [Gordonia phage Teatealatte]QBP29644.1 hypothetical protein SEA_TREDGE_88 [Gordonia phage Tredge]
MTNYEVCPHCLGDGKVEVTSPTRVRITFGPPPPAPLKPWQTRPATQRQLDAVERMAAERDLDYELPKLGWQASNLISMMGGMKKPTPPPQPQPAFEPPPEPAPDPEPAAQKVYDPLPLMMVSQITDGRYAITADDNTETIFLRKVTHKADAKNTRMAGATVLQHRIAEDWNSHTVYWPSGQVSQYSNSYKNTILPEAWAQVFVDPQGAAHRFAEREHRCCSCGTNLTDARSRHYGIGPECEKARPDVIGWVNDNVGPFVPGAEQD